MNARIGFMAGIGAGLMAGAFAGAMAPTGRREIRKLGRAVEKAVDNVISDIVCSPGKIMPERTPEAARDGGTGFFPASACIFPDKLL